MDSKISKMQTQLLSAHPSTHFSSLVPFPYKRGYVMVHTAVIQ